jgi:hypothetical protein
MTTFDKYVIKLEDLSGPNSTEIIRNLSSSSVLSEFKSGPSIDTAKLIGTDKNEYLRSIKSDDYTRLIGLTQKTEAGIENLNKITLTLEDLREKFKERTKTEIRSVNPGLFGINNLEYAKNETDNEIGKIFLETSDKTGIDLSEIKTRSLKEDSVRFSIASFMAYPFVNFSSHAIGTPFDFALFMNKYILTEKSKQTKDLKSIDPEIKFLVDLLNAYGIKFEEFQANVPLINAFKLTDNGKIKFSVNIPSLKKTDGSIINNQSSIFDKFMISTNPGDKLKEIYNKRYEITDGYEYADIQLLAIYYLSFNHFYDEITKILDEINRLAQSKNVNQKMKELIDDSFRNSKKSLKQYIDACFIKYFGISGDYEKEYAMPFKINKDKIEYTGDIKLKEKIIYDKLKFSNRNNLLIAEDPKETKEKDEKTRKNLLNFFTILNYKNSKDPFTKENIYMGALIQQTDYFVTIANILNIYYKKLEISKKEILKFISFEEQLVSNGLLAKDLIYIRDRIEKSIKDIDIKTQQSEKQLECQKQVNQLVNLFLNFTEKELTSKDKLETKLLSNKLIRDIDIVEEKETETDQALNYLKQQNHLKQEAMIAMIPTIFRYMNENRRKLTGRDLNLGCAFKDMLMGELLKKKSEMVRLHEKELQPKLLAIKKDAKANEYKYRNALKSTYSNISSLTPVSYTTTNIRLKSEGMKEIGTRAFWERVYVLLGGKTLYVLGYQNDGSPTNGEYYRAFVDLIRMAILADKPDELIKRCFLNVFRNRTELIKDIYDKGYIIVCNKKENLGDYKEWKQVSIDAMLQRIENAIKKNQPKFIRFMIYNMLANDNYFQKISLSKWDTSYSKKMLLKLCSEQVKASELKLENCEYITCREQVAYTLSSNMGSISSNYNLDFSSGQSIAIVLPALTKIVEKPSLLKQFGGNNKKKSNKKKNNNK